MREQSETLATEVEVARAISAFARRHQVLKSAEEAERARTDGAAARATAEANEKRATALDADVVKANAALAKQLKRLPSIAELQFLEELQRERDLAEAALGGGISVTVRPSSTLAIRSRIDQEDARDAEVSGVLELAAERTLQLTIGDLVEVDILAGSAEKRKQVETLQARWRKSAVPVLKSAGASTLAEVRALHAGVATEQQRIAVLQRDAEQLRTAAQSLRDMAAVHNQKAASSVSAEDLQRLEAALGDHDRGTLERHFANLGKPSETKANALHEALAKQHAALSAELVKAEGAAQRSQDQLADAQRRAGEAEASLATKLREAAVGAGELDAIAATYAATMRGLRDAQATNAAQVQALTADAGRAIKKTAAALEQARAALVGANEARDAVAAKRDAVRSEHGVKTGALEALREQVARLDRESAVQRVVEHERELAGLPDDGRPLVDLATATRDVETAQREYERAKEELDRKEGALTQVGGNAVREEVARLEEARAAAQLRERALEIDAEAWKLLHETLRAVENEEGVHLGRALAVPVAARFEELTAGRYRALRLDASLQAEGLQTTDANDDDNVLAALSVGTRDQLAALIRLTIADQLRSAVVLDDHLVHSDLARLQWFREVLQKTAVNAQVIVLTCRAEDYVRVDELPTDSATRDVAAGTIRTIDAMQVVSRYGM
ncbi:MAG TPA: hypothetical protein VE010_14150, partial [Thermoanaerobaculia bacterium]|nr:hypothetical protein [Thermoanaerobaculia bacterium]